MKRCFVAFLLLIPALASAQPRATVSGVVKNTLGGVVLRGADGTQIRLAPGSLAESLAVFAETEIEVSVEGTRRNGVLTPTRVVSPTRRELSGTTRAVRTREGLSYALEAKDKKRFDVIGGSDLLSANRRVLVDAWIFEDGRAWVIALEAKTTGDWTLLERELWGRWVPTNVIRGQGRRVWIVARNAERLSVRRGDKTGWVLADSLEAGAPAVNSGLIGRVPQ